jgi:hypothetical protein
MTVRITGQCRPDRGTIDKSSAGRDYRMPTFDNDIEPVVSVQNRRWGALDDTHDEDFLGRGQVKSYDGISAIEPGLRAKVEACQVAREGEAHQTATHVDATLVAPGDLTLTEQRQVSTGSQN